MGDAANESTDEIVCLICLDGPREKEPLRLLSCGCRSAWFHTVCESTWVARSPHPLVCPTCRRLPNFKPLYSFSCYAGEAQWRLWSVLGMIGAESTFIFALSWNTPYFSQVWIFPVENVCVLCIPFMIRTRADISFYMNQVRLRYCISLCIFFGFVLLNTKFHAPDALRSCLFIQQLYGLVHICYLLAKMGVEPHEPSPHPFTPFIADFCLEHSEVLLATKPVTSATKRREGGTDS
jgi:hypothetical protein